MAFGLLFVPLGDVYKAAMPSGLKLESETMVEYNPDFESLQPLSAKEQLVLDLLSAEHEQCVSKLEKDSGIKNILPVIKSLLDKGALFVKEELRRNYKPRTEVRVRLCSEVAHEEKLQALFTELGRAPKQLALLMKYLELSAFMGTGTLKEVSKKELLKQADVSANVFAALVDKRLFEVYDFEVGRLTNALANVLPLTPLNECQRKGYAEVVESFKQKNVCLLHGVTSSGKTEIYIHLIADALAQGKQVLYLLPK